MRQKASIPAAIDSEVTIFTGGFDKPYAYGLTRALARKGITADVIGSDDLDGPEMRNTPGLKYLNLHGGWAPGAHYSVRMWVILSYYTRLMRYCFTTPVRVFHILWNGKFTVFDRTLLMLIFRLAGKKIAFTAHNVNAGRRDGADSLLNRLTLRMQYRLVDHIFVHTPQMREELVAEYGVSRQCVSVIPFGVNDAVPQTSLTRAEARRKLGLSADDQVVLFFGNIRPYKGLEYLVRAAITLREKGEGATRLLIAGQPLQSCPDYWRSIEDEIRRGGIDNQVLKIIEYVPDCDTEIYFKAADVSALPYTHIYQSGVLLLGYSFGLPAIAADVGAFRDDIVEGRTGLVCKPCDPDDLAATIERYFRSDLYRSLDTTRQMIRDSVNRKHSWDIVADLTTAVYRSLRPSNPLAAEQAVGSQTCLPE